MARIDHIAFRVPDRQKTVRFLCEALGYRVQQEFPICFNEAKTDIAMCTALEPPEKIEQLVPWTHMVPGLGQEYHIPPEIFVSDGTPGSIVDEWVNSHGPGIHHIAIQVDSVQETIDEWTRNGWAKFSTEEPLRCEGLAQVFSKPSQLCGVIFEFIERDRFGFCKENVKTLMESTRDE